MEEHPFGWLSLLPSLTAIVLAIVTRRVILSMLVGLFVGATITRHGNLFEAVPDTLQIHLWESLVQEDRLRVFAFTILMGAMIGVIERSGGMAGLVQVVSQWASNRQRGQLATWLLGLIVFFDDYANTVLLGNTLQPLCERLRISKEKLAYLVDSTAAPVAGLALISTWVAGEIEFIQNGLDSLPKADERLSAFSMFINSLPYRFYAIWALTFVLLVGLLQRDYGPMLKAERDALSGSRDAAERPPTRNRLRQSGWWNAVLPITVTVSAVLWLLYQNGLQTFTADENPSLWQIFGNANSYVALLWGSLTGVFTAVTLTWVQRLLTWTEIEAALAYGAKLMLPALAVLWLASALSAMTGHDALPTTIAQSHTGPFSAQHYRLYTGEFLTSLVSPDTASAGLARWMPTLIFLLSAGISFATGTSWGTMAIVMPVAIPLVGGTLTDLTSRELQAAPIMLGTIGSVLAGSIFGDHCSPISDTTVLSSQSCGCDHAAHVWTQLPYAVTVGAISIVCGTIPIGFGAPVFLVLPIGIVGMFGVLYLLGQPTNGRH